MNAAAKFSLLSMIVLIIAFPGTSRADYYSCSKKIYEQGWLRKYEYKGTTWRAASQKSGVFSTIQISTEDITSSVDPGVTTGQFFSSAQYVSSWGECAAADIFVVKNNQEKYIEQNMTELKKQVALGHGYHVDSLAVFSGCSKADAKIWSKELQAHTAELYDAQSGAAFGHIVDGIIKGNSELTSSCQPLT